MGMDELLRYVKKKPSLMKIIRLRQTEKKSLLLCDLNAIVSWTMFPTQGTRETIWDTLDLQRLSQRIARFVSAVKDVGSVPVFFCDSITSCFTKLDFTEYLLPRVRSEYVESIELGDKADTPYNRKYSLISINSLMYAQVLLCLASLNVKVVHTAGSLLSELAVFAGAASCNYDMVGVVSYDMEFAVFSHIQFIHMDFFDLGKDIDFNSDRNTIEIVCGCLNAATICRDLNLPTAQSVIDLAIMLGNSFSAYMNKTLCFRKCMQLHSIEDIAALLRKYDSPVFNCFKLSFFLNLYKQYNTYNTIISKSYALYNNPEEFQCIDYSQDSKFSQWALDKICSGHFPIYFHAILKFGIYMKIPFYRDYSINTSRFHEETLFLRKILYFFLEVDEIQECTVTPNNNKQYSEVKLTRHTSAHSVSALEHIHTLPLSSKYKLMAMLLSTTHVKMNTKYLNSLIALSMSHEPCLYSMSSLISATTLHLVSKIKSFDNEVMDIIYCSVFLQILGVKFSLSCDHFCNSPTTKNIHSVNGFSYVLHLVYDLCMLIGLNQDLPPPESIYNPSSSLRLFEMRTSSMYCDTCNTYFTHLVSNIVSNLSVRFLKFTCSTSIRLQCTSEFILSFDKAVGEVKGLRILDNLPVDMATSSCCDHDNNISESCPDGESLDTNLNTSNNNNKSDNTHSVCDSPQPSATPIIADHDNHILESCPDGESLDTILNTSNNNNKSDNAHSVSDSPQSSTTPIIEDEGVSKELSILKHRGTILELVQTHRVVCIEGETGCGKSTMVPQFILDSHPLRDCNIIICQPRRVSVVDLAKHVASSRSKRCGFEIGFCTGGTTNVDDSTKITYSTAGHFQQVLVHEPNTVSKYTHIILDEIHDRTITYDFVSLLLRKMLVEGLLNCKLVLMSATMQSSLFLNYFVDAFGIESVSRPLYVGRGCYPVEEYFIDEVTNTAVGNTFGHFHYYQQIAVQNLSVLSKKNMRKIFNDLLIKNPKVVICAQEFCTELIICQAVKGMSILVFLPGLNEILDFFEFLIDELQGRKIDHCFSIFVLHSQIPIEEQEDALKTPPPNKAHVILATNVAESSLTISKLHVVMNFGLQKSTKYDYKRRMTCLTKGWCSKAACTQRKGRVGRLSPGKVYHLFPKFLYGSVLSDYDQAEMCSHSLAKTILQARVIGEAIGITTPSEVLKLAIQPPSFLEMDSAVQELVQMGALMPLDNGEASESGRMSLLGEFSINFPLDIDLCRLILYGLFFGCCIEAIVMAAGLSLKQDCFTLPSRVVMKDQEQFLNSLSKSMETRFKLDSGYVSDPILFVQLFWEWLRFCHKHSDKKFSKMKLVNLFSKQYAINCQRFLQLLSSVSNFSGKVKVLIPPSHPLHEQLTLLVEINDLCTTGINETLLSKLLICMNVDQLRALLAATFIQNLLYGVRKIESPVKKERDEAQLGMIRILDARFNIDSSLVVRQHSNGGEQAVIELLNTILPDSPKRMNMFNNLAVVEFPTSPDTMKNINTLWQFGERRYKWCVNNIGLMYGKPFQPYEVSWFRWSNELEKVEVQTWRNRTGLLCDFTDDEPVPSMAIASSLEGNECQEQVKAKNLTILPPIKKSKLSILLLMAFQCYSSTVMFTIDHVSNTILSIKTNSQELQFGLWQEVTATDLRIVNVLRDNLSSLLYNGTCKKYLPIDDFLQTQKILYALVSRASKKTKRADEISLPDVITDTPTSQRLHVYYPTYNCSILDKEFTSSHGIHVSQGISCNDDTPDPNFHQPPSSTTVNTGVAPPPGFLPPPPLPPSKGDGLLSTPSRDLFGEVLGIIHVAATPR